MISIEVVGYKKLTKNSKVLYYLSAQSYGVEGTEGITTYNGFVSEEYIASRNITEDTLIGSEGNYYTFRENGSYHSAISLNTQERRA